VAAGSVVTKDVPDYALVVGNHARQRAWMSRHGHPLIDPDEAGIMVCPESGFRYALEGERVSCLDLAEDVSMPEDLSTGTRSYRTFKGDSGGEHG
jgi:UDP-2-acetamido-3-amino-2,3-dideoxy-glucuronate N-acetyltransferase